MKTKINQPKTDRKESSKPAKQKQSEKVKPGDRVISVAEQIPIYKDYFRKCGFFYVKGN